MTISLPKMARRHAALGILAVCSSYGLLASAQIQNPVVVMDSIASSFNAAYPITHTEWGGPAFTSGSVPTRITEITFGLSGSSSPATLRLFPLDDSTELPSGPALATASLAVVQDPNNNTNSSPNTYTATQLGPISTVTLLPNKKYALILSAAPDAVFFGLCDNNGPGNAYTYAGGFSVAAAGYLRTSNSGTNWQPELRTTPILRLTVGTLDQAVTRTPIPTLGVLGLLTLSSAMALLGIRRSRRPT